LLRGIFAQNGLRGWFTSQREKVAAAASLHWDGHRCVWGLQSTAITTLRLFCGWLVVLATGNELGTDAGGNFFLREPLPNNLLRRISAGGCFVCCCCCPIP